MARNPTHTKKNVKHRTKFISNVGGPLGLDLDGLIEDTFI